MKENKLTVLIPIIYAEKMHETKPGSYMSHCLGHEGEGSLLSALIKADLATSLTSYSDNLLNSFSYLMIQMQLTDYGLENYLQVVEKTFTYLKMMKENGPSQYAFDEAAKTGELNWTFIDKMKVFRYVTSLTEKMTLFSDDNMHKVLSSSFLYERFDKPLIQSILDSIDLSKVNLFLYSQNHTADTVLD